jgi:hypothetical protein
MAARGGPKKWWWRRRWAPRRRAHSLEAERAAVERPRDVALYSELEAEGRAMA